MKNNFFTRNFSFLAVLPAAAAIIITATVAPLAAETDVTSDETEITTSVTSDKEDTEYRPQCDEDPSIERKGDF
ncbi:MAG: hypothetical protein LUE25_01345 [Clostridiales bacterium]|nr:hypothetical protein [Clostridiales bacterium]